MINRQRIIGFLLRLGFNPPSTLTDQQLFKRLWETEILAGAYGWMELYEAIVSDTISKIDDRFVADSLEPNFTSKEQLLNHLENSLEIRRNSRLEVYYGRLTNEQIIKMNQEQKTKIEKLEDKIVFLKDVENQELREELTNLQGQITQLERSLTQSQTENRQIREELTRQNQELEEKIKTKTKEIQQFDNLISPNQPYNFSQLHQELKRLKIQDLTIQIPLKKQELEQLTNNLKNNLGSTGKYLLNKLLKKHQKALQENNETSDKLEEIKQALQEEYNNQESLQTLLEKQKKLYQLEKHLENLQNEQIAQIQQVNLPRTN